MAYEVTDRRPIAARRLAVMGAAADRLARAGVSANVISIAGTLFAATGAAALVGTAHVDGPATRLLWLWGAVACQLRLLCNLFDGMVAVRRGTASAVGELYNDVPDRFSDAAILASLGYAAGGLPALAWAAAVLAVATAYIRTLGKAQGLPSNFGGVMAKQQRMFLATLLGLCGALLPTPTAAYHLAAWFAGIIALGSLVTCIQRLRWIARALEERPAGPANAEDQ